MYDEARVSLPRCRNVEVETVTDEGRSEVTKDRKASDQEMKLGSEDFVDCCSLATMMNCGFQIAGGKLSNRKSKRLT